MMDDAATEANASRPGSPVPPVPELPASRPTYRFTWDPALRRAGGGPGSVSEATDLHRADDDYAPPQGSELFALHGLALALPHDWSSAKHGFNAISTVLNNPHKRAAPPKAHSALPAVAAAELPRVRRKDFEPYLSSVASEWERFERSTRLGRAGVAQLEPPPTPEASTSALPLSPRTPQPLPHDKPPPPLALVPAVFFRADFDLGDPATFALVTEAHAAPAEGGEADPAAIAHALPLLEKLSHYADTTEQHLVREISRRTAAFFAALTNLQELQAEAAACAARIARLRGLLSARTARTGLALVALEARRANIERVAAGVRGVRDVREMLGVARGLVHAGEWGEALGVIAELEALWRPPPPPPAADDESSSSSGGAEVPFSLAPLHAFAALPAHLRALTQQITAALSTDVVGVLTSDLRERMGSGGGDEAKADELLRDRMKPLVQGLVRTQGVRAALGSWREVVLLEVRAAVKRNLPTFSEVDEEDAVKKTLTEKSAALAKELREMPHEQFYKLLRRIFASLMRCVRSVQKQNEVVSALLASISAPERESAEGELGETLSAACELANARAAAVLGVRAEQHAALGLGEFHAVFATTWRFVVACEVLCRRMLVGLRGAAVAQAKAFLGAFHAARLAAAARRVEEETWAPAEVPAGVQRAVGVLVDAAMADPGEYVLPAPEEDEGVLEEESEGVQRPLSPPSTPPQGTPPPAEAEAPPGKQLRIEERAYFAVGATLEVLVAQLGDYIRLVVNLPLLTTDAMGRVIEFLKAFNSRTCQVVLGAGAMRSAGLKNITAKHLALASQSLAIGVALVPYVRETFRRHLSATQAVMLVEFDKLRRDLQEHQHEIHAKLVVIMGDRLGVHCRALGEVQWGEEGTGPNGYAEVLVKETVTLHKVLTRYLGGPTVELVMTQVLAAINHRLSEEWGKIELGNQAAKDRLLVDVRCVVEGLRHVGGGGGGLGMLERVVQEKSVGNRLQERMAAVVVASGAGMMKS